MNKCIHGQDRQDFCQECDNINFDEKLKCLAIVIEQEQIARLKQLDLACQVNIDNCKVIIKPGKKYYKLNLKHSGRYMIDTKGNIYGIKAYGQINKKKWYGTLDTINDYYWGDYTAIKKRK
ncbi:MAG: hypothetical protein ACTSPD_09880 [Promethearchaeota archaeon]